MFLSKRNGIYYLWFRDEYGKRQKVTTHARTKSKALEFLRNYNSLKANTPEKILLSKFIQEVLSYYRGSHSPKTVLLYERALNLFYGLFGDMPITSLTARHYDLFKTKRVVGHSPVTANIDLRSIKSTMSIAVRWKYLTSNPFDGCKQVSIPETPPRYYKKEDFIRLLSAIQEPWLKDLVQFALLTGMRKGEIMNLKWSDVDLTKGLLYIQSDINYHTKMGKRRIIPMSEDAFRLLQNRRAESTIEYVFTFNGKEVNGYWATRLLKRYVRQLGLDDRLNFHSIRHSTASWLAQSGVSIYQISKLLGHSSVQLTQDFYAHMEPEALRDGINKINLQIDRPLSPVEGPGESSAEVGHTPNSTPNHPHSV